MTHYFNVGDLITLDPERVGFDERVAAVVVKAGDNGHDWATDAPRCVFLEPWAGHRVSGTLYAENRFWYLGNSMYSPQPLEDPTPEQKAMAMFILLTGHVPGVDELVDLTDVKDNGEGQLWA